MPNNVKAGHKDKQSYANTRTTGKEQYYTTPEVVDICLDEVRKHIDLTDRTILEPCGGTGEFIKGFRRIGIEDKNILSFDIEPKHPLVKQANYLDIEFDRTDLISITNPPFGRTSSLAKQFFEHAAGHCEYICYLIPKSWRKWTTQNSLNKNFHLVSDIELPKNCFYKPDGEEESKKDVLNTVFQIWKREEHKRSKFKVKDHGLISKVQPSKKKVAVFRKVTEELYHVVDDKQIKFEKEVYEKVMQQRPDKITGANFQMVVFGHSCGKCEDLDPNQKYEAKTTTMYFDIARQDVKDAMKTIDFSVHFNNVAYVQALSLQEINYELNNYFGLPS